MAASEVDGGSVGPDSGLVKPEYGPMGTSKNRERAPLLWILRGLPRNAEAYATDTLTHRFVQIPGRFQTRALRGIDGHGAQNGAG
jgi:hypothetical protein